MNKKEHKEFLKRYDKFQKNNLPTPFWDEERQTLEWVTYKSELDYWDNLFKTEGEDFDRHLDVNNSLTSALENVASTGFYYPFTSGYFELAKITDEDKNMKIKKGETHAHSFDDVVYSLYNFPETFSISKDQEKFYSEQELRYLKKVQKYLLFLGLKDKTTFKTSVNRYRNSRQKKYGIASIKECSDKLLDLFITGKINFIASPMEKDNNYSKDEAYPNHDYKELIIDSDGDFRLFIEFTHQKIQEYREIKDRYTFPKLKDDDKVVVQYFKVLEIFKK